MLATAERTAFLGILCQRVFHKLWENCLLEPPSNERGAWQCRALPKRRWRSELDLTVITKGVETGKECDELSSLGL